MLAAQAKVFNVVMGYMGSMSLKCAVELGIPDLIHLSPGPSISISSLLSNLPAVPDAKAPFLLRVMRLLAQMGFFNAEAPHREGDEEEETSYSLTPLSAILLKDSPVSLSPWLRGILCPPHVNTWQSLGRWLQSDSPGCAFEHEHGKSMWELASLSPEINALVNEFMAGDTRLTMTAVVDRCKDAFRGLRTLVDVGGGTGASARAIARAFPGLKCTVYDLPHVVAAVPEDPLVDAVGGDMFERIPRADAIFLKCILHDWSDEECVSILSKCRDSIPADGGKVIIVDIVVNDRKDPTETETQLLWDVGMMAFTDGKEREEHEWKKIFTDSGFTRYKITPIGVRSLIEVFP